MNSSRFDEGSTSRDRSVQWRWRRAVGISAVFVALTGMGAGAAQAQEGVSGSGMGQGEAAITARSDVRLGIESGPGTSGERLQQMANAVSAKLGDIRTCYASVAEERPTVTGEMRLVVRLPEQRAARVQLRDVTSTAEDAELDRCVRRAIQRASYTGVGRPAQVTVALTFTNTAAQGVREVRRRSAEEGQVDVRRTRDGLPTARGGTPNREVTYQVIGSGPSTTDDSVAAMQRSIRTAIAGLLDCRRRAGRHDMSSEGDMELQLQVPRRGRARVRTVSSSLTDTRAPTCVSRILGRARFEPEAAGAHRLKLHFTGRSELDVPTR
jgi:hypothetical protein